MVNIEFGYFFWPSTQQVSKGQSLNSCGHPPSEFCTWFWVDHFNVGFWLRLMYDRGGYSQILKRCGFPPAISERNLLYFPLAGFKRNSSLLGICCIYFLLGP